MILHDIGRRRKIFFFFQGLPLVFHRSKLLGSKYFICFKGESVMNGAKFYRMTDNDAIESASLSLMAQCGVNVVEFLSCITYAIYFIEIVLN